MSDERMAGRADTDGGGTDGSDGDEARPVWAVRGADDLDGLPDAAVRWAQAHAPLKPGTVLAVPGEGGALAGAILVPDPREPFVAGKLNSLPAGRWRLEGRGALTGDDLARAHAAVALGAYRFARYRSENGRNENARDGNGGDGNGREQPRFEPGPDAERLAREAAGVHLARDLVNTPASDMGPAEIEGAARALAERHGARVATVEGEALASDHPMIHAVGRASSRAPRLIDMAWGEGPRVTLVGKGVAFDTGGLDIKSASNMLLMKKDMGGAAATLGLAHMLMEAGAPVRLRVLIPAVENAIDGSAFRPGDVLRSRKGLSVEIGNTDAEGRLILADALALADEEEPELVVDLATLTGAARVALGPDVPPLFTRSDAWAERIARHAEEAHDPVWRLPLHDGYARMLKSEVADLSNVGGGGMAGAITAALFLDRFVERARAHVHLDIYGWCPEARPHCPKGGEAQAIRALSRAILEWSAETEGRR